MILVTTVCTLGDTGLQAGMLVMVVKYGEEFVDLWQ